MEKTELIKQLQEQLSLKEQELDIRVNELKEEYDTQKYINELLNMARKSIPSLAEYLSTITLQEKDKCINLMTNFIKNDEEIEMILNEAKNLFYMKKRDFDIKGVPQYNRSKQIIEQFYRRINQYNLTRNFKYTNPSQINELKSYLERVRETSKYFENGKLVRAISDINEVEYIIEKSDIEENQKTAIIYALIEENNKFYIPKEEGDQNAIETI